MGPMVAPRPSTVGAQRPKRPRSGKRRLVAEPRADGLMAAQQLGTPAGIEAQQTGDRAYLRKPSCIRELCHRRHYPGVLKFMRQFLKPEDCR
jgi:hypothetical protein